MNWTTRLAWIGVVWICVHVNYIAADELLQPQKEPTIGELKVFIAGEFRRIDERFNQVDGRFDRIETGLDKIEVGLKNRRGYSREWKGRTQCSDSSFGKY